MKRKQGFGWVLLIWIGGLGWFGYRTVHQSLLNHHLFVASTKCDPLTVRALLAQGADPNMAESGVPESIWQRFLDVLLQRNYKYEITPDRPLTQALLSFSTGANRIETIRLLLEYHADPNATTPRGYQAILYVCACERDDRLLTLLLQHGADPNPTDRTGSSPLAYEESMGLSSGTRALLDHGANPNLANAAGDVPLMWAALHGQTQSIALLLAHGADVNHKNNQGQTALTYALFALDPQESLERLLAAGADVNATNSQGCSPFLYALLKNPSAAEAMLAKGGDVHKAIPLFATTHYSRLNLQIRTDYRAERRSTNFTPPGTTPLMFAVFDHDPVLIKAILMKGVDVNARDAKGKTALDYVDNDPQILALLLHAGAHP